MKEFNNAKMTEEELDQVAGGQNKEFGYDGDIEQVKKFLASGSGGGFSVSSWSGEGEVGLRQLDELVKTYRKDGYVIIKKWEL